MTTGMTLHQGSPGVRMSTPLPSPSFPEAVERQPSIAGTGTCDDGLCTEIGGKFPGQLFGTAAVTAKQRNHPLTVRIEHQHSRIPLLSLEVRRNQSGDRTHGAHHHKNTVVMPVLLENAL